MNNLKRLLFWSSIAVTAAAIIGELRKPAQARGWHGYVLGVVPYDFRPPSLSRLRDAWWNPDDERLLTPRDFGVGWAVNLHRAYALLAGKDAPPEEDDQASRPA